MSYVAIQESVLDMLACRMERSIDSRSTSISNIFDVPKNYLDRYHTEDRETVSALLKNWCTSCIHRIKYSSELDHASDHLDVMEMIFTK